MTPINEMEEITENSRGGIQTTPVPIDVVGECVVADMEMAKMRVVKLEAEPVGDGDGLSRAKEVQINIETETTTDSSPAPVLPLSKISDDVASTISLQASDRDDNHSVEFSEEKEVSTRVYDFDMVKEKTLPRRMHLGNGGILQFCSSQPKTHLLAWSLMGTAVVTSIIVFTVYWLVA